MKYPKKKQGGDGFDRGAVKKLILSKPIALNGVLIKEAIVEIDHINYGLDVKSFTLNKTRRSNFKMVDIEKFLQMLDGEYIPYKKVQGRTLRFEVRINCPITGRFKDKEFILIFETDYNKPEQIHTITLYPNW